MPGPSHRHHLCHLPAPRVPVCPTPLIQVEGAPVSTQGMRSAHKGIFSEAPGPGYPSGPLPTTPLHCPRPRRVCPRIWGKGQRLGSHLSGVVADRCAAHIAEDASWLRFQSNPRICTWRGSHPSVHTQAPPSWGRQSLNSGPAQP